MIENPKVGQRVWWQCGTGLVSVCVVVGWTRYGEVRMKPDKPGRPTEYAPTYIAGKGDLYDSPRAAAAALRQQAQKLLLAASKLEQEAPCETESR